MKVIQSYHIYTFQNNFPRLKSNQWNYVSMKTQALVYLMIQQFNQIYMYV